MSSSLQTVSRRWCGLATTLGFVLGFLVSCAALLTAAHAAAPLIRILPLGDSITYGLGATGGYRLPLNQLLTNAGYSVDFVGTQTGNGAVGLPDSEHEG